MRAGAGFAFGLAASRSGRTVGRSTNVGVTAASSEGPRHDRHAFPADQHLDRRRDALDHDVVARATALVPTIREYAEKSSEERRVAPEVMTELEEAGLFTLLVPARLGGLETNLRSMMECVAEVGRGDGSTAWAVALLNVCTWFATTFSDRPRRTCSRWPRPRRAESSPRR